MLREHLWSIDGPARPSTWLDAAHTHPTPPTPPHLVDCRQQQAAGRVRIAQGSHEGGGGQQLWRDQQQLQEWGVSVD